MTPGIERDELVARLADLYMIEEDARHELCGTARQTDTTLRTRWLKEAADRYRAACEAREQFIGGLTPDQDTAIRGEAVQLARDVDHERFDRRYGFGKYAKTSTEARP